MRKNGRLSALMLAVGGLATVFGTGCPDWTWYEGRAGLIPAISIDGVVVNPDGSLSANVVLDGDPAGAGQQISLTAQPSGTTTTLTAGSDGDVYAYLTLPAGSTSVTITVAGGSKTITAATLGLGPGGGGAGGGGGSGGDGGDDDEDK
jgi:hypothetical protein